MHEQTTSIYKFDNTVSYTQTNAVIDFFSNKSWETQQQYMHSVYIIGCTCRPD